jgi:hypothetical protein
VYVRGKKIQIGEMMEEKEMDRRERLKIMKKSR